MSGERLRAVIVGGHIGRSHAKAYLESDRTDLVAVCDIDPMTLDAFGDEFIFIDFYIHLHGRSPGHVCLWGPVRSGDELR